MTLKSDDKQNGKGKKRVHAGNTSACRSMDPILGLSYQIRDRNGQLRNALLMTKRTNNRRQGIAEYFVHFEGTNRRMDEWVDVDRIEGEAIEEPDALEQNGPVPARPSRRRRHATAMNGDWDEQFRQIEQKLKSEPIDRDINDEYIKMEMEFVERTKVKFIDSIQLGKYEIQCWYFSPYPQSFRMEPKLYICEHCLSYMKRETSYRYHLHQCPVKRPPGREIYRKENVTVYDVDSKEFKLYCQKLCLLGKLFLDHKTIYYEVDPFAFYVATVSDHEGEHLVGYFSKEKRSADNYNLACILVLPPYQQHGYGKFLISLSYELSKRDGVLGSPERPLSDLGLRSYDSYWRWKIVQVLRKARAGDLVLVTTICEETGFAAADVFDTLRRMQLLTYFKGKNVAITETKRLNAEAARCSEPRLLVDPALLLYRPESQQRGHSKPHSDGR